MTDMAGHVLPSGEEARIGVVNDAEEIPENLFMEGFDIEMTEKIDLDDWDWSTMPDIDAQTGNQDSGNTGRQTPEAAEVEPESESQQQSMSVLVSVIDWHQADKKTERPDSRVDSGDLDDKLFADGLPADTFDEFKTPSQIPETSFDQYGHVDPQTSLHPSPKQNLSTHVGEPLFSAEICRGRRLQRTIDDESINRSIKEASPPPSDGEDNSDDDDDEDEEDKKSPLSRKGRNSDSPFQGALSNTKRQKQELALAPQSQYQPPVRRTVPNPMYVQNERYSHAPSPSQDWDCFKYSKDGELKPSRLYSVEGINHYLWDHPRSSELVLRIHRNPPRSRNRFPTTHSHRCRFEDCPATNNTINQGQIAVSFCENDAAHPNHDPFIEAGWVHLYCLERFTDFPRVCAELNITADTRKLRKEEPTKRQNLMAFGTAAETKLVDKFIKACQNGRVPNSYPEKVDGEEYEYEGTLCYRLACTKVKKEPNTYNIQRQTREKLAGYKGSNIANHMGDLAKEAELRDGTRKHKNQNSLLEGSKADRAYRGKEGEDLEDEHNTDSEGDRDGKAEDDDGEQIAQDWLMTALQRPRPRHAPTAGMGQPKPSPKPQRLVSAHRAPTRTDRIAEEWVQSKRQPRAPKSSMASPPQPPAQYVQPFPQYQAPSAYMGFPSQRPAPRQPQLMPQHRIPAPYTGPLPQLPSQYPVQSIGYIGSQGQLPSQYPAQPSQMSYMGPQAPPSVWQPKPAYAPPPQASRKRTSDEAGNDPAPMRYGRVPGSQPIMPMPQRHQPHLQPQQPQPPSKNRGNDSTEDSPKKRHRHRLAPSLRKATKPREKKGKKSRGEKALEIQNAELGWRDTWTDEHVEVRKMYRAARERGEIADEDLVVQGVDWVEPSPEVRRRELERLIGERRRRRDAVRDDEACLMEGEEGEGEMGDDLFGEDEEGGDEMDGEIEKKIELEVQMMKRMERKTSV